MIPPPPRSTLFPYTTLFRSLGAQGQLWTEYMADPKQVEYMAFPRVCALAEVLWTPREERDYADFRSEEHTSELQSHSDLVCRLLLEKKKKGSSTPSGQQRGR